MSNEQITHELLLDRNFRLDENGGSHEDSPLTVELRERFECAFWRSLLDDLKEQQGRHARVWGVLSDIRDGVGELLEGTCRAEEMKEAIDVCSIEAKVASGEWAWGDSVRLVEGI
eukprot:1424322-Rhodomonas_salina.1